ncbi:MAG: methyltransferase family protein [Beutenbergiaceae bacterium]
MKPYPPIVFGTGLLVAFIGHQLWPLSMPDSWWVRVGGAVLIVAAAVLALLTERAFHRARTPVLPFKDATTLITTGPMRISRNPIYLAFSIATIGIAPVVGSWWPLIPLPLVLMVMTRIIRGEEVRLQRLFGDAFTAYCARTRRWL